MTETGNGQTTTRYRWARPAQIVPSELQPRKHFAPEGIAELVTSFSKHGFDEGVSRLLVRPLDGVKIEKGEAHFFIKLRGETVDVADTEEDAKAKAESAETFELVAGERRWRASAELNLDLVPIAIQDLTDLQVLQKQLIENLQRESLTAMEEALAYKRLEGMGQSRDEIAASAGKSVIHVNHRMVLCRLIGTPVAEAIEAGTISPSHGLVLAGVPSAPMRLELLEKVFHPPDGSSAPWSREALEEHIKLDYVRDLREAIFDKTDPDLVPVEQNPLGERMWGGSCEGCPFNVAPEDASSKSRARFCKNLECWDAKEMADYERWRDGVAATPAAIAGAVSTLSHAENEDLWNESGRELAHHSRYVDLEREPEQSELRSNAFIAKWKTLTKGQELPMVLGRDAAGNVHELALHDLAKKAAHLNGHKIFRDSEREDRTDRERSSTADRPAPASDEQVAADALATSKSKKEEGKRKKEEIAAIVTAAQGCVRRGMLQLPKEFWGAVVLSLLDAVEQAGELDDLAERQDFELDPKSVQKMTLGERLGLTIDCLITLTDERDIWAKVFDVDLKKIRKRKPAKV